MRRFVALLASAAACVVEGSVGHDAVADATTEQGSDADADADAGDATGAAIEDGSEAMTTDDGAASGGQGDTADGGSAGDSGTTMAPTDGSDDGGPDTPVVCQPTPDDGACATCRKAHCCEPLDVCLHHDACLCWWECSATGHQAAMCERKCGPDGSASYHDLVACEHAHCDVCEGAGGSGGTLE